jgi:hypothetical protein
MQNSPPPQKTEKASRNLMLVKNHTGNKGQCSVVESTYK